jgi:arylsulfatase A-like enzyme
MLAGAVAGLVATCLDLTQVTVNPWALLAGGGMAAAVGLGHGAILGLGLAVCAHVSAPVRYVVGVGLGLSAAFWLTRKLGVFWRLGGPHDQLATLALAGSMLAGLGFGVVFAATARSGGQGFGPRSRLGRDAGILVLVLGFVGSAVADRGLPYLPVYPAAQLVFRVGGLWSLILLFLWAQGSSHRCSSPDPRWLFGGLGAVTLVLLAGLRHDERTVTPELLRRPYPSLMLSSARRLTDFDGDGFSGFFGGGDCAPFDETRGPTGRDIPGNGIDENCMAGDAPLIPADALGWLPEGDGPSPVDVVLVTVDSLRADRVGAYGYGRATTPNLDRWAQQAQRFERAYTVAGWTSLAVSSLLRGRYPRHLRWTPVVETTTFRLVRSSSGPTLEPGEGIRLGFSLPLDDPHPTLATRLSARGMATAAVVDDGFSSFLSSEAGQAAGFDTYREMDHAPSTRPSDAGTVDVALELLDELARGRPFFLWVHLFGVHAPSETHDGAPRFGSTASDRYDHEVAFADAQLGRLLDAVDALEPRRSVAVVVTSDHGETITTGTRMHGFDLREDVLRIPLFVRAPGWAPGVRRHPATLVDLMPTILALTETPAPDWLDGENLARQASPGDRRVLFADVWRSGTDGTRTMDRVVAFDGEARLTLDRITRGLDIASMTGAHARPSRARVDALVEALEVYLDAAGAASAAEGEHLQPVRPHHSGAQSRR